MICSGRRRNAKIAKTLCSEIKRLRSHSRINQVVTLTNTFGHIVRRASFTKQRFRSNESPNMSAGWAFGFIVCRTMFWCSISYYYKMKFKSVVFGINWTIAANCPSRSLSEQSFFFVLFDIFIWFCAILVRDNYQSNERKRKRSDFRQFIQRQKKTRRNLTELK